MAVAEQIDKIFKGGEKLIDDIPTGTSKKVNSAPGKIDKRNETYSIFSIERKIIVDSVMERDSLRSENKLDEEDKCPDYQWRFITVPESILYSEPKFNSTVIGKSYKDDKVCIIMEKGEWVQTLYGWMLNYQISEL